MQEGEWPGEADGSPEKHERRTKPHSDRSLWIPRIVGPTHSYSGWMGGEGARTSRRRTCLPRTLIYYENSTRNRRGSGQDKIFGPQSKTTTEHIPRSLPLERPNVERTDGSVPRVTVQVLRNGFSTVTSCQVWAVSAFDRVTDETGRCQDATDNCSASSFQFPPAINVRAINRFKITPPPQTTRDTKRVRRRNVLNRKRMAHGPTFEAQTNVISRLNSRHKSTSPPSL